MSSNTDQQPTSPNSEAQTGTDQSNASNHSQESNAQKLIPKTKPKKRKRKLSFEGKGPIIAAIIGAVATLAAAYLNNQNNQIQSQLREREKEIIGLKAEIDQRDAQIKSLTDDINNLKNPLPEILARDGKIPFEWQWAGENWYGRMIMEEQGGEDVITQAQVGLLEKNFVDDISIHGQVLNLVPGTGSVNITEDGVIHLEFAIKKKDRRTSTVSTAFVTGDLQQALCYAGKVNYRHTDTGSQYPGDIILVNYITPLGDPIDYWFSPNKDQPWFERYLVDR